MRFKIKILSLMLAGCFAWFPAHLLAQKPAQKCPVAIKNVELSFHHSGGQSMPQLGMTFANHAAKRIANIRFGLSLLDSGGYPHAYHDDLVYREGLSPDFQKHFLWDLERESIEMSRTGEKVVVLAVGFDDATAWKDDGSESCTFTVDYHPR